MKKNQLSNLTLSIFILMAFVLTMSAMLFNGILDKVAKNNRFPYLRRACSAQPMPMGRPSVCPFS